MLRADGILLMLGICDFERKYKWYFKSNASKLCSLQLKLPFLRTLNRGYTIAHITSRLWPDGTMWHKSSKIIPFCSEFSRLEHHIVQDDYRFTLVCKK